MLLHFMLSAFEMKAIMVLFKGKETERHREVSDLVFWF